MSYEKLLLEYIDCVINEECGSLIEKKINTQLFKQIPGTDPNQKGYSIQQYLSKQGMLPVGQGSSRETYILDPKRVFKLAMNPGGIAQNQVELKLSQNPGMQSVLTKIYDSDPSGLWIVSELVRPITNPEEFKALIGVSFDHFWRTLAVYYNANKDLNKAIQLVQGDKGLSEEEKQIYIDLLTKNTFVQIFLKATNSGQLELGDLSKLDSFGKTADGKLVLLDYGQSPEFNKQYNNSQAQTAPRKKTRMAVQEPSLVPQQGE